MVEMRVSIITSCYNREFTIRGCIESVLTQDYKDIEYIVIDGASSDRSMDVINEYKDKISVVISEKDSGMYEAINKGLRIASGDIVGLLHSDDFFYDTHVVSRIVDCFKENRADVVYGDGIFVKSNNTSIPVRKWISGKYNRMKVVLGWLPLHPTVYVKRNLLDKYGLYDESFKIAADSDFLVRYFYKAKLKIHYVNSYFVRMRMGGLSTDSKRRKQVWNEDIRMYRKNGFLAMPCKLLKMSWKVPQFINAKFMK